MGSEMCIRDRDRIQQAQAEIEQFRSEVDADGKLKHPYFNEVEGQMVVIADNEMRQGIRRSYAEVYEDACWANKEVRAKKLAAEKHEEDRKRRLDTQKRRNAAGGLTGGSGHQANVPLDLEEELLMNYERMSQAN